jgi:hypothetical protein
LFLLNVGQNSEKLALIINFAPRNQPMNITWILGCLVTAESIFSPSSYHLRAVEIDRQDAQQGGMIKSAATIGAIDML